MIIKYNVINKKVKHPAKQSSSIIPNPLFKLSAHKIGPILTISKIRKMIKAKISSKYGKDENVIT